MTDLDELDVDDPGAGASDSDGVECPDCGLTFDNKIKLGIHRAKEHGIEGINKRKRGRSSGDRDAAPERPHRPSPQTKTKRARLVSETLVELADLLERRGDNVDALTVAGVIRRDADKIGNALAGLAERRMFAPFGPIIDALFGDGGPLSFITALGPTFRKLIAARPHRAPDESAQIQAEFERLVADQGEDYALRWAALNGIEVG